MLLTVLGACRQSPPPVQADLATSAAPTHVFKGQWGGLGTQPGRFRFPNGIAASEGGDIYVADTNNNRVQRFTAAGVLVLAWGGQGSGEGQFLSPRGVAVAPDGSVYVADTSNNRVQKFAPDGTFLTAWGEAGTGNGQLNLPFGVAVDGDGYVYVTDTFNQRIQKFSASGVFVAKWGRNGVGKGQFSKPAGIAVDGDGHVYVSEIGNHRVQRFSTAGVFEALWGGYGTAEGRFRQPYGLAVDGSGRVFVADKDNLRVQLFSPDGAPLGGFATENSAHAKPNYPLGVAVAEGGDVVVTDLYNNLVQMFAPASGDLPTVLVRVSGRGTFSGQADLRASVSVNGDPAGGTTVTFSLNGVQAGSAVADASGVAVLSGVNLTGVQAGIHEQAVAAAFTMGELYGSAKGLLRVDKARQTLLFTPVPARARVGSSLALAASASSGLPVLLTSDTPETCAVTGTVTDTVATFTAPGPCGLRAAQAGNANYHAAAELLQEVVVHQNSPTTLTGVSGSGVVGGTATLAATLGGEGAGLMDRAVTFALQGQTVGTAVTDGSGRATLTGVALTGVAPGGYPDAVTASFAGEAGFEAAQGEGTLVVAKAAQTLTFTTDPPTDAAVGGSYTVSAHASSGLTVSFTSSPTSVCTASGNLIGFVGAGTCTVSASQPGDATYDAVVSTQSFTVGAPASSAYTLNLSTLPVGRVIWNANVGRGITTGTTAGYVTIFAKRRDRGGNTAMVVGTDHRLIISKDGTSQLGYATGGTLDFGFGNFGTGRVGVATLRVKSTTTLGGGVSVYRDTALLKRVGLPRTGSGGTSLISLNVPDATLVRVTLTGPGAVDDVVFSAPQQAPQ